MKKSLLPSLIISVIFAVNGYSQWSPWSDPSPLTNNNSNNSQGAIHEVEYEGNSSWQLFWVKQTSEDVSGIYMKDVYGSGIEIPVIEADSFLCRNPRILTQQSYYGLQPNFVLFYESNQFGNFDIFFISYDSQGWSAPQLLASSPDEENHLQCSNDGSVVWEAGGTIYYRHMDGDLNFSPVEEFDGGNCSEPVLMQHAPSYQKFVAWKKGILDADEIYYKEWNNTAGQWSDNNFLLFTSSHISSLNFANNTFFLDYVSLLFWDSEDKAGITTLYGYDFNNEDFYISDFTRFGSFHPAGFINVLFVKYYYDMAFLAFENRVNGHNDIFVNEDIFLGTDSLYFKNLSDTITEDRNPAFFMGAPTTGYNFYDLFLIWEKEINGTKQIYASTTIVGGSGIDEQQGRLPVSDVKIVPNPFTRNFSVSFSVSEKCRITLRLLDNTGKEIDLVTEDEFSKGDHSISWKAQTLSSAKLRPGIYYLQFTANGSSRLAKIIMQ